MPNIILKKTFKVKPSGFQVAAEKSFSFHGSSVTQQLIQAVNQKLATIQYARNANRLSFHPDAKTAGHYTCIMNHDCQKYNEEDAVVAILDVMEILGWDFRFQYDSESSSTKVSGSSFTSRELFILHKRN
jgi:hypothetical protein